MPIVEIHPQKIFGSWASGIALDFHTTSSVPIGENEHGHMVFATSRPPVAELLYQLKYRGDQGAAQSIVDTAASFLAPHRHKIDILIPVPPSTPRPMQPVYLLADGIGRALGIPVARCISTTRPPAQLKGVEDLALRKELLAGLYTVDGAVCRGKQVLLFDDLYRSGSTMSAIADVLLAQGGAAIVRALTITKTRVNK